VQISIAYPLFVHLYILLIILVCGEKLQWILSDVLLANKDLLNLRNIVRMGKLVYSCLTGEVKMKYHTNNTNFKFMKTFKIIMIFFLPHMTTTIES
jgi:hypothetical protein